MKKHHIFSLLAIASILISTVITNGSVFIALWVAAGAAVREAFDAYRLDQKDIALQNEVQNALPEPTIIYTYNRQG